MYNYVYNYMYTYSFHILYVQFHGAHMQTTFDWSCPPLWNIDRAVLEECNVKSNIKSHGCNSKKLIKTKNCFYFFVSISIQQYHHIHTPVSPYQICTLKCSVVLLNHHFVNTIYNCYMFQPLEGHLQGV